MKLIKPLSLIFLCLFTVFSCDKDDETNDPVLPTVIINDLEVNEGDENNTISITLSLSGTNEGTAVINYATVDKTAYTGADYSSKEGTINFNAGETEKTIEIEIIGDEFEEEDEKFEILLLNPINAVLQNTKAVITILDDDAQGGSGIEIPTTGYVSPLTYPNMALVWSDEFQGGVLNQSDWNFEIGNGSGGWGNNELQYYKEENTTIQDNEYLMIEAKEQTQSGFNYTSSRLTTQGKRSFKYGRIDIRAVLPEGQGIWPALWMLGDNLPTVGWPACGELDIMELVGHLPNQVHGTAHYGSDFSQHQHNGSSAILPIGEKYSDEFHVFSLVWVQDKVEFLVDDEVFYTVSPTVTSPQPYPFNESFFFIFNIAVGGNWPGSPNATTIFPQRMFVDYIRVFQ